MIICKCKPSQEFEQNVLAFAIFLRLWGTKHAYASFWEDQDVSGSQRICPQLELLMYWNNLCGHFLIECMGTVRSLFSKKLHRGKFHILGACAKGSSCRFAHFPLGRLRWTFEDDGFRCMMVGCCLMMCKLQVMQNNATIETSYLYTFPNSKLEVRSD